MDIKTQLDFILNPVVETKRLAPQLPLSISLPRTTSRLLPHSSSDSINTISSWISNPAMPPRARKSPVLRDIKQLHGLESCKKIANTIAVSPSTSTPSIPLSSIRRGVTTVPSSDGVNSILGSPTKSSRVSLSLTTTARRCKERGCASLAVSRFRCVRHGGGSRCLFNGCTNGAKRRHLCFQHGGSTICLASGCTSKAKRYGLCWSHGGGRICSYRNCQKVAAQGGSCWAHGGGNRCKLKGCRKRSYQKYGYFCKRHATCTA